MELKITGYRKLLSKKNKMKVYNRRLVKTKELKDFESYVAFIALEAMKEQEAEILKVPVELELKVWFGDKRKRDLQNCFDTVCDSLENIVYTDDSQIRKLTGYKYYEKNIWKFEILIRPLSEDTKTAGEET
jgi:Holliday junction resolvase RusA-like endonuclease